MTARGGASFCCAALIMALSGCIIYAPNRAGFPDPFDIEVGAKNSRDLHLQAPTEAAFECSRRTAEEMGLTVEMTQTTKKGGKLLCKTPNGRKLRVEVKRHFNGSEIEIHTDSQDSSTGELLAMNVEKNLANGFAMTTVVQPETTLQPAAAFVPVSAPPGVPATEATGQNGVAAPPPK